MTSKFDLDIFEIILGSKYNSSDLNFKGKLSELNIWGNYNINVDPEVDYHQINYHIIRAKGARLNK
jgi:hypothetical protein